MTSGRDQTESQAETGDEGTQAEHSQVQPAESQHSSPSSTVLGGVELNSEWSLGPAPSLPSDNAALSEPQRDAGSDGLAVGSVLLDYQIHQVLGQGAFGKVYLALQLSLNRFVALKVARDFGSEGRTMAQLEHANVVQVYSEQILAETSTRLLCMQFVSGPSLQGALRALAERDRATGWSGRDFLMVVDQNTSGPAMLQVSEISERESIQQMDFVQVTCHLAAELAQGLAYAHERNIVHRDIKPANILISSLGRPLLADFNLAEHVDPDSGESQMAGGTLAYMAPEQIRAYLERGADRESVGPNADIYSLALVLVEMLTGSTPLPQTTEDGQKSFNPTDTARRILQHRSTQIDLPTQNSLPTDRILPTIVRRATQPDPVARTESASLFAAELQACQRMRSIEVTPGFHGRLTDLARRFPVATFAVLAMIPHLLASAVNVSYNALRVPDLPVSESLATLSDVASVTAAGTGIVSSFHRIAFWYNIVVWPGCLLIVIRTLRQSLPALRMRPAQSVLAETQQRRTLLHLPRRLSLIAMLGWLPGLLLFPLGLYWFAGAQPVPVTAHFVCNLGLSFLIALTYTYLGVIWLIVSVQYPHHWDFPSRFTPQNTVRELDVFSGLLARCKVAAGAVPLLGALLVIGVSPDHAEHYLGFRLLLGSLIILGMAGHQIAMITTATVQQKIDLFCGRRR